MLPVYTLSYDHSEHKQGNYLRYWKLVRVTAAQINNRKTNWVVPPEHVDGKVIQVVVDEFPNPIFVIKDGMYYRELKTKEEIIIAIANEDEKRESTLD